MEKKLIKISVSPELNFAELNLRRKPDGQLSFNWEPIERLCANNGLDIAIFRDTHEDNVSSLIVAWYMEHLAQGGDRDPVQDELIAEAIAEDKHGGGYSHQPGRA